jgi:subfamily B ATP-binding cassette protein MsbA
MSETPSKKRPDLGLVWRESKDLLWERRRRLLLGLVLLIISRLSNMVLPASSKWLIDEVINKKQFELLPWIAAAAGVATLISAVTSFALSLILGVAGQRSINDLRLQVQKHVGRLPVGYFDGHKSGELVSRIMNDAEGIRNLVGTGFVQLVGGVVTAAVAVSVLFWLNWRLTSITLFLLLLFAVGMAVGFGKLRPVFRERSRIRADLTGRLVESINGIRVVKAYTAEEREEETFATGSDGLLQNIIKSMVGVSTMTSLAALLFGLMGLGMAVVGTREVMAGRMSLGDLFMYLLFTGLMVSPLIQIGAIGTQIMEAFAGLDRIREILSETIEPFADTGRAPLPEVRGDIAFEDVWFEYREGLPVLKGVSFEAAAGTTTALVGPSGSGKSTLIGLVMAFHDPAKGRVLVDGKPLESVSLEDYRRHLGIVLQDNFLFAGTIQENIAYSRPGATDEAIREASRIAHCHEFIEGFPDGYETVVGERGIKLSGGQRQRIAIARAILADPKILILDEATSSLDSESEALIQAGLRALLEGRTTFVIAHRLSTIRSADQILVLDEGEIVERGDHAHLLAEGGLYKSLYDRQYHFELDRFINPGEDFTPEPEAPALPPAPPVGVSRRD